MANISKITLPDNTNYDLKDTVAREISALNLSSIGMSKKNLLKNTAITKEKNGIIFTVNDDGSVTVTTNGKAAESNTDFPIGTLKTKKGLKYILSGCPQDGTTTTYRLNMRHEGQTTNVYADTGKGVTFTGIDETMTAIILIYAGTTIDNLTFYPMICYADITDKIYETYQDDLQTQINLISPVHNYVYMAQYLHKNLSLDKGYIIRIGNQLHLNFTATCTSAINSWEAILGFPFYIKSPAKPRYYIYNTQEDETKITLYMDDNKNEIYTQSNIAVGNKVYIKGLILDIKGEQNFPTDTGWDNIPNPDSTIYGSTWNTKYRKIGDDIDIYVDIKTIASISCDSSGVGVLCTLPSEIIPSRTVRQTGYMNISSSDPRMQVTLSVNSDSLKIYINEKTNYTIPAGTYIYGELRYFI